jgi:hypothetical protein
VPTQTPRLFNPLLIIKLSELARSLNTDPLLYFNIVIPGFLWNSSVLVIINRNVITIITLNHREIIKHIGIHNSEGT